VPVKWENQCAAVIPCFDEGAQIAQTVRAVKKFLPNVLVVNDGSRDQTSRLAAEAGAFLIDHPTNRGKGVALRSGCKWALDKGFWWGLLLDGDGQHAAADIPAFFGCAARTQAAMVAGDRSAETKKMPLLRRLVNAWMTARLSSLTGRRLADSQCGFRLVNLEAWSKLKLAAERFEVESEWLVQFLREGFKVEFIPVQVRYGSEKSSIRPVSDSCRWLRWWLMQRAGGQLTFRAWPFAPVK
jgi:glycosyltransferase involved in cell wall biosynthesis